VRSSGKAQENHDKPDRLQKGSRRAAGTRQAAERTADDSCYQPAGMTGSQPQRFEIYPYGGAKAWR
jgi:hypothetical protein